MTAGCRFPACVCERQCGLSAPQPVCAFPSCGCEGLCRLAVERVTGPPPAEAVAAVPLGDSRLLTAMGKPCPYCGETMGQSDPYLAPTKDHLLPRSRGGTLEPANRLIVCRGCNEDKADRTLDEFATWLRGRDDDRYARVMHLLSGVAASAAA